MAEILIEKLFDATGDIKPVKWIECKDKDIDKLDNLLREKLEFLPDGQYFASKVDKNGSFQSYITTIIISDGFKIAKSDYDEEMLTSIHRKK